MDEFCGGDGQCRPGCREDADCTVDQYCEISSHTCQAGCAVQGFADTPVPFALPPIYHGSGAIFQALSSQLNDCDYDLGYKVPAYSVTDLDGDARPDLVVTMGCDEPSYETARTKWIIHRNTGNGFSAAGSAFNLPAGLVNGRVLDRLSKIENCTVSPHWPRYTVLDMDGDGLQDLLVTYACDDASIGTSRWLVYPNTGTGFSSAPVSFALPPIYHGNGAIFRALSSEQSDCDYDLGYKVPAYSVTDLDGDARPDLVVTMGCDEPNYETARTKWIIHRNTGSAFSPSGCTFSLPADLVNGRVLDRLSRVENCSVSPNWPRYTVLDMGADRLQDFLVTYSCDDASVGKETWWLFNAHR